MKKGESMSRYVRRKLSRRLPFGPFLPSYIVMAVIFGGLWCLFAIAYLSVMPPSFLVVFDNVPILLDLKLPHVWGIVNVLLIAYAVLGFLIRRMGVKRMPNGTWAGFVLCLTLLLGLQYNFLLWGRVCDSGFNRDEALLGASYGGDPGNVIPRLLEMGARPDLQGGYLNQTALHNAVIWGVSPESVRLLLDHGADPMAKDHWLHHPHDYLFLSARKARDLGMYPPAPLPTTENAKAVFTMLLERIDDEQIRSQAASDALGRLYGLEDDQWRQDRQYSPEQIDDLTTFLIDLGADPSVIDR